jgi:hypothetical protein
VKRDLTPERIAELSFKVEKFVAAELGQELPLITVVYTPDGKLALFTNRKSDEEILIALEAAIDAIKGHGDSFRTMAADGKLLQ